MSIETGTPLDGTTPEPIVNSATVDNPAVNPVAETMVETPSEVQATDPKPEDPSPEIKEDQPVKIKIDEEEFTLDQIKEWKLGNMRQSDYTRKTQEVAKTREENKEAIELYSYLKENPHIAKALADQEIALQQKGNPVKPVIDPISPKLAEVEEKLAAIELDNTINALKAKYTDFNEVEVLNYTLDPKNGVTDLEKAYKQIKADKFDVDAFRKQVEKETIEKIKKTGLNTETIVSGTDKPLETPNSLSPAEKAIAMKLGLTEEEYQKWK